MAPHGFANRMSCKISTSSDWGAYLSQKPASGERMREIVVGAAQMGPIQRAESREAVVMRMLAQLEKAVDAGCDLVVYPELCLTTFFPRWLMDDTEVDAWFEREMPSQVTQPLFDRAAAAGVALSLGYAELTSEGRHFNTQIVTDRSGALVGKYRKVHLPGHAEYDPERTHQHLEKRYFEPGDLGFPVWRNLEAWMGMLVCNDRRWPEAYRELGLQGVELIMLGYNTPTTNSLSGEEDLDKRIFHSTLCMQAGAYQNSTWIVGVAKAGVEDGHGLFGGSVIVDPDGVVVQQAETEGDELLVHACDMDKAAFGKATIFDFKRHRRVEHYQRIASQTGVIYPDGDHGMSFDLVVRNGTIATAETRFDADIGIRDGRITAIGEGLKASDEIDATGRLVLPGGIEAHCHIAQESGMGLMCADGYRTGSISAAVGGNSSFVPFAAQRKGWGVLETLDIYDSRAAGESVIDYGYHLIISDPTPEALAELPKAFARGVTSFKVFMTYDISIDDGQFLDILSIARAHGALTMVHAENKQMIAWMTGRLLAAGHTAPRYHAPSRPALAEEEAIGRAISLALLVDAPLFIVHVSTAGGAESVRQAQAEGARIFAETCPQYLFLTRDDLDRPGMEGAKYICSPPVRDLPTQEVLWDHLRRGTFEVVSSDHAPYRADESGKFSAGPDAHFQQDCQWDARDRDASATNVLGGVW